MPRNERIKGRYEARGAHAADFHHPPQQRLVVDLDVGGCLQPLLELLQVVGELLWGQEGSESLAREAAKWSIWVWTHQAQSRIKSR